MVRVRMDKIHWTGSGECVEIVICDDSGGVSITIGDKDNLRMIGHKLLDAGHSLLATVVEDEGGVKKG